MIPRELFELPPYEVRSDQKAPYLLRRLNELDAYHYANNEFVRRIYDSISYEPGTSSSIENLPFLHVGLFKHLQLKSVDDTQIIKTLTSSGTTGQTPSRIFLDKETTMLQSRVLVRILQSFLGKERLPMLIVDHPNVVRDPASFSARGAGILGMMKFGSRLDYLLGSEDMSPNFDVLNEFVSRQNGNKALLFGFTFMIWEYFIKALESAGRKFDLSEAILVHSGGWKKLQEEAVSNEEFKQRVYERTGISKVHNFYGMVEQVGAIFMECEKGYFHCPTYSDVITRDPEDWSVTSLGRPGTIQLVSSLPSSYPGHSILTEDTGIVYGVDDCDCGRKGKYFTVSGRVKRAEIRGCSDAHEQLAV